MKENEGHTGNKKASGRPYLTFSLSYVTNDQTAVTAPSKNYI